MSDVLNVHYQQHLVGQITRAESGALQFEYSATWQKWDGRFPISLSLPLDAALKNSAGHHFFANLLPEGNVREQICSALKVSANNDFELLRAIGGDCAGALIITPSSDSPSDVWAPRYERISEQQLEEWSIGIPGVFSEVTGRGEIRLSLAGAQDKLPVHVEGDEISIPLGNTPSTHILKFASPHYSHLPENETFVTMLAREVGLPVTDVSIRRTARGAITLITRYDRHYVSGRCLRLHQEDFCQALAIHASHKYEKEGGPSLKQCVQIVRGHASYPLADLQKLLQWTLFNLFAGNADAHGKNLSLLYDLKGTPSLAPFYDLVCTRNYKKLSREMAMRLGGATDPDLVTMKHFAPLAADFGFRANIVVDQLSELADRVKESLPVASDKYRERFGDSPILTRIPTIVRKLVRRVQSLSRRP